jgi:hypothetical protein
MKSIPRLLLLVTVVFAFLLPVVQSVANGQIQPAPPKIKHQPRRQLPSATKSEGEFKPCYNYVADARLSALREGFQKAGVLEGICNELNNQFNLPVDVTICFSECGERNAFYKPQTHTIDICYEIIDELWESFEPVARNQEELKKSVGEALVFIIFHELGHALIHVYDLPVTGREEDAVDQFSTLLISRSGGVEKAFGGASFFYLSAKKQGAFSHFAFWDEHSLSAQRFYEILCLIYGSDPNKFSALIRNGSLPLERGQRCQSEYMKIDRAWLRLLKPHVKAGSPFSN